MSVQYPLLLLSPNGDINDAKQDMDMACSCTGMAVMVHVCIMSQTFPGSKECRRARISSSGPGSSAASSWMVKVRVWKMGLGLQWSGPRERSFLGQVSQVDCAIHQDA